MFRRKVFKQVVSDGTKCPGCNWDQRVLFRIGKEKIPEIGLCGDCLMNLIEREGYIIEGK